jgi:prophage regulatory protein
MSNQTHNALTILRRKQVEARTGLSRSTIYSKMQSSRPALYDPSFPKPISLGAKSVGWIEAEIEDWLARQIQKSRKA